MTTLQDHKTMHYPHIVSDETLARRAKQSTYKKKPDPLLQQQRHQCDACGRVFARAAHYNAHVRKHYPGRQFEPVREADEHQRIHDCLKCDKSFRTKHQLHNHDARVHRGKSFLCSECGKGFSTSGALNSHSKVSFSKYYWKSKIIEN